MQMYLNDSAERFEFVLHGDLKAAAVRSLEHAWVTATSILDGKELVVDVSAVAAADDEGLELLYRMRRSGACLRAVPPFHSEELLQSLAVPVAPVLRPPRRSWAGRLRRVLGLKTEAGSQ
jgi:hypothetical protein